MHQMQQCPGVTINDPKRLNVNYRVQRRCVDKRDNLLKDYTGRNNIIKEVIPVVIDVSKDLTKEENDLVYKLRFYTGTVALKRDTDAPTEYTVPEGTEIVFDKKGNSKFRTASEAVLRSGTKGACKIVCVSGLSRYILLSGGLNGHPGRTARRIDEKLQEARRSYR
jgi:hypothetical protein